MLQITFKALDNDSLDARANKQVQNQEIRDNSGATGICSIGSRNKNL